MDGYDVDPTAITFPNLTDPHVSNSSDNRDNTSCCEEDTFVMYASKEDASTSPANINPDPPTFLSAMANQSLGSNFYQEYKSAPSSRVVPSAACVAGVPGFMTPKAGLSKPTIAYSARIDRLNRISAILQLIPDYCSKNNDIGYYSWRDMSWEIQRAEAEQYRKVVWSIRRGHREQMETGWNPRLMRRLQDKFNFKFSHIRWLQQLCFDHKIPLNQPLDRAALDRLLGDVEPPVLDELVGQVLLKDTHERVQFEVIDHQAEQPSEVVELTGQKKPKFDVLDYTAEMFVRCPQPLVAEPVRLPSRDVDFRHERPPPRPPIIGVARPRDVHQVELSDSHDLDYRRKLDTGDQDLRPVNRSSPERRSGSTSSRERNRGSSRSRDRDYRSSTERDRSGSSSRDDQQELFEKRRRMSDDASDVETSPFKTNRRNSDDRETGGRAEIEAVISALDQDYRAPKLAAPAKEGKEQPPRVASALSDSKSERETMSPGHARDLAERILSDEGALEEETLIAENQTSGSSDSLSDLPPLNPDMARVIDQIVGSVHAAGFRNPLLSVLKECSNLKRLMYFIATKHSEVLSQLIMLLKSPSVVAKRPDSRLVFRYKLESIISNPEGTKMTSKDLTDLFGPEETKSAGVANDALDDGQSEYDPSMPCDEDWCFWKEQGREGPSSDQSPPKPPGKEILDPQALRERKKLELRSRVDAMRLRKLKNKDSPGGKNLDFRPDATAEEILAACESASGTSAQAKPSEASGTEPAFGSLEPPAFVNPAAMNMCNMFRSMMTMARAGATMMARMRMSAAPPGTPSLPAPHLNPGRFPSPPRLPAPPLSLPLPPAVSLGVALPTVVSAAAPISPAGPLPLPLAPPPASSISQPPAFTPMFQQMMARMMSMRHPLNK